MQENLLEWINNNQYFNNMYLKVLLLSVEEQFDGVFIKEKDTKEDIDWGYLLLCASILAKDVSNFDKVLRITQTCIACTTSPENKDMATIILNSLSNIPAINLAEKRKLIEGHIENRLNFSSKMSWTRCRKENLIETTNGEQIFANKFQNSFWNSLKDYKYLSVTAPTAAGKTFIVKQWIVDQIKENDKINIVYIVPTRALIYELEEDFKKLINENDLKEKANVTSMPINDILDWNKSNIFVFTQERFYLLLSSLNFELNIFAMIIDEAYKIGDDNRGLLLQQIIEWGISENSNLKLVFISPFTANPERLLEDIDEKKQTHCIKGEELTVNQNILWVEQQPHSSKKWALELICGDKEYCLNNILLKSSPSTNLKRISYIVDALTHNENIITAGNIIYVNGAAEAEKVSQLIYDLLGEEGDKNDVALNSLIELCRKTIHNEYVLCKVLKRGVAFHYGNMPILIKAEIERLFNENIITHLICTSTLVEGVNMSCRSIFMRGPKKGKQQLMSNADFWNLAGRAGRWGTEFQGNIICIDPNDKDLWNNGQAPKKRQKYYIRKLVDNNDFKTMNFLNYIRCQDINTQSNHLFDQFISYLVAQYGRYNTIKKYRWSNFFPNIDEIEKEISNLCKKLPFPLDIIENNPGINPIHIIELYNYFIERNKDKRKNIEELLLCDPSSNNAVDIYNKAFQRINGHLTQISYTSGILYSYSIIVVSWMRGYPLKRIIANRIKYMKAKKRGYKINTLIRETMELIEGFARYTAPKYLKCYSDVLKYYLTSINRNDLVREIQDFSVFLEFGVSQKTQLSLLYLGFSRTAVSYIFEYMTNDNLDQKECLSWFHSNPDWVNYDLPDKIKQEIIIVLSKYDK